MNVLWEGVAESLLRAVGLDDPPVDAFEVAHCCGLKLRAWPSARAAWDREADVVCYPAKARHVRQQGMVAHELGHFALDWAGERQSERGASYIGGAILLPRRPFARDATACGWNLADLQNRHPNASAEAMAHRLAQVSDVAAAVYDQGRLKTRVSARPLFEAPPGELEALDLALTSGRFEAVGGAHATPLFDGPHRRVVVVSMLG